MKKETKTETKDWRKMLVDLEKKLNEIFGEKAPKLPESVGNFLVKYGPYFIAVGVIIAVLSLLVSLGLLATVIPGAKMGYYGYGYHYGFKFWNLFSLGVIVLQIMALQGLFKRSKSAWNLMFYASLVEVVSSLFSSGLISAAIGAMVFWYLLFQIRRFYK